MTTRTPLQGARTPTPPRRVLWERDVGCRCVWTVSARAPARPQGARTPTPLQWICRSLRGVTHRSRRGQERVSEVFRTFSCRPPCDEIPVFTGMRRLEYGAIPHNSVENRSPNNRDPGGPRILKQARKTRHYRNGGTVNMCRIRRLASA